MNKLIIPAIDWFFVHKTSNEPIVWPLAAWALNEKGETVGLIAAFGAEQGKNHETPSLSVVPNLPGRYLHQSQLTAQERKLLAKRAELESAPVA